MLTGTALPFGAMLTGTALPFGAMFTGTAYKSSEQSHR
jgi:hypothetical protein